MDVKKLKGIAVVAIESGEKVGAVDDVLFNLEDRSVQALAVKSGGLLSSSSSVVEMADVKSIGSDAVMIADRGALQGDQNEHRFRQFPDLGDVTSLRVVTEGGSFVGTISTVRFDEQTGQITDVEISKSGLGSIFGRHLVVPISAVVSIGRDVVVIPDSWAEQEPGPTQDLESPPESAGEQRG